MAEIKMKKKIKEVTYRKPIFIPKQQCLCQSDEVV